jgi:hypothetical protein
MDRLRYESLDFLKMPSVRDRLWIAALWAMMPVTLVSGMPRLGCICANGQYKLFCERLLHFGGPHEGQPSPTSGCCCCRKSHADRHAAMKSVAECCCHAAGGASARLRAQSCCKPVIGMPTVAPAVLRILAPDLGGQMSLVCPLDFLQPAPVVTSSAGMARNPELPVPDLIIAHQVLLI